MSSEIDAMRVWFRLIRLQTRSRVAIANRLRVYDLSVPQCDVLTTLTEKEGLSQQELASRLYVTKGNISGLVDRLVANGLVERRSFAGDRRSHAIHLTPAGRDLAVRAIEAQKNFVTETFGQMAPKRLAEFEQLLIEARDLVRARGGAASSESVEA
jgi:MarR family transcriptional regulator, organic hydroperoxide resistance regulator